MPNWGLHARTAGLVRPIVVAIVVAVVLGAAPIATAAPAAKAPNPVPKVAFVVGPVGGLTTYYRNLADEGAKAAEQLGANVVRVYSPDATWDAVRKAIDGASIVVYLGHGNGFPSRYRDELYPPTQNGFGLNPEAGVDDQANAYYGEGSLVASGVKLAPNAVVVLSHLCYASGNTEPGLEVGPLEDSIARVDNFAAGFMAIGAKAVVAEGHMGPAWYVRQLLASDRSVEKIWAASPSAHGNVIDADSVRTKGVRLQLDPDRTESGFYRSLALVPGLTARQVRAAGDPSGDPTPEPPPVPSLVKTGIEFERPAFAANVTVGATVRFDLAFSLPKGKQLPETLLVGTSWTLLEELPAPPVEMARPVVPDQVVQIPGDVVADLPDDAAATPEDSAEKTTDVSVGPATIGKDRLSVEVTVPAVPGVYRLRSTIHDEHGDPYDAATQKLVRSIWVQVSRPIDAHYVAPAAIALAPQQPVELTLGIVNVGSVDWAGPDLSEDVDAVERVEPDRNAQPGLRYRWVRLEGGPAPAAGSVWFDATLGPGERADVPMVLPGPTSIGRYLLLVDVVTPEDGPLAWSGVAPATIPVTVAPLRALEHGGI